MWDLELPKERHSCLVSDLKNGISSQTPIYPAFAIAIFSLQCFSQRRITFVSATVSMVWFKRLAVAMIQKNGDSSKHMCFLCLWNSRDDSNHYKKQDWLSRTEHIGGKYNVKHPALIDSKTVHFPPLSIKLRLTKNFVKGMDHQSSGFQYSKDTL